MLRINNLPYDLSRTVVENWITSFVSYVDRVIPSLHEDKDALVNDLTIEFSDVLKPSPYKSYGIRELISEIKRIFGYDRDCWFSRIESIEQFRRSKENIIGSIAREKEMEYEEVEAIINGLLDKVIDFGDNRNVSPYLAGEYYYNRKTIILYNRVIRSSGYRYGYLERAYEDVFIHELFHHFHYYTCCLPVNRADMEIMYRHDYTATVVKESLASYFENRYCLDSGIPTRLDEIWYLNDASNYPYAGAKYVDDWTNFVNLFTMTYHSFDEALINQVKNNNKEDFFRIKNKKTPRKSTSRWIRYAIRRYSESEKLEVAYYFLTHNDSYAFIDKNVLHCPTDRHGATSGSILKRLGVLNRYKGILRHNDINDEILTSSGLYNDTLRRIKDRYHL